MPEEERRRINRARRLLSDIRNGYEITYRRVANVFGDEYAEELRNTIGDEYFVLEKKIKELLEAR